MICVPLHKNLFMKKTLVDLFEESVKKYPNNTFLLEKTDKVFEPTTYAQVKEKVYQLGAGLQALGVKKGDNMALLSEGRNMWVIGELAMFYAGAANVPLSIKLEESNDLMFRLLHGDVKYIMVSHLQCAAQFHVCQGNLGQIPAKGIHRPRLHDVRSWRRRGWSHQENVGDPEKNGERNSHPARYRDGRLALLSGDGKKRV